MRARGEAEELLAGLAGRLAGLRVCVNGLGISGVPVARALAARGALVTALDARDDEANREVAGELAGLGVSVELTGDRGCPPGPNSWSPRPDGARGHRWWRRPLTPASR